MATTHYGTSDLIELQPRERWTPRGGFIREPRTKMRNSSVSAFTSALREAGYAYEVEPITDTPFSIVTTLTVDEGAGADTILSDLWELDGNDLEKSIWELPKVREQLERTEDLVERAAIRNMIEESVRGADGAQAPANFDPDVYNGLLSSLIAGVEAFPVSTYVLRRSITLPARTTLAPAFANSNAIFSTDELRALEPTIPANLRDTLPAGFWQKKTPTAAQQPDGRWVYRVEYWWAEDYDPFIYDSAN